MIRIAQLAPAVLAAGFATASYAADADRYVLEKSGDHFVRMDRQTGEMSVCRETDGDLVCKTASDERADPQREIELLQSAIAGLDGRVTKLENSVAAKLESSLPSEEEFQRSMGYMQRFLREFMGVVKELDEDKPAPNRT